MKKYYVLFVVLFPVFVMAKSPDQKIDSLKNVLTEGSPDSLKAQIYKELCLSYKDLNMDTCFYYGQLALDIIRKYNWPKREANILLTLGYLNIFLGNLPETESYLSEAMKISSSVPDTFIMINVQNTIAQLNFNRGRGDLAIKQLQESYEWAIQIDNKELILRISNNLGVINGANERYEDAIKYFNHAKELAQEKGDNKIAILISLGIATANKELGNQEEALSGFREAIRSLDPVKEFRNIADTYVNIADILYQKEEYSEAMEMANAALIVGVDNKMKPLEAHALYIRAKISSGLNVFEKAIADAKKGLKITNEIGGGSVSTLDFFYLLAHTSEQQEKFEDAFYWQKKYSALSDSLQKLGRENEIASLEISFQTKQKELENISLKKEKESQYFIIQQRTKLFIATAGLALLLLIVAFLLYQARRKTKFMNTVLEEKVRDRTDELETSNTRLLQSNEELKRFAYIASHDLKEPLRNMGGFISLIKRRLKQREELDLIEYIEFAEKGNFQMVELIDNILDYSKLESKQNIKMEFVELQKELDSIRLLSSKLIESKGARINYTNLPNIYFNASVIKIILKNLIENGIKYNKSEAPQVDITCQAEQDSFIFYVKDNGIGIAAEYHTKIFEMFTRLHNRDAYKGSGMGLAFCKKILDNNGGSIRLESKEGQGSTFIVSLPAKIVYSDNVYFSQEANENTTSKSVN